MKTLNRIFLSVVLFFPLLASAQEAPPAEAKNWLPLVLGILGAMVTVAVSLGAFKWLREKIDQLFDYLAAKTKLNFLANVDEVLVGFAVDLYNSEIKLLKDQGEWNAETKKMMFNKLKEKAKQHFGLGALGAIAGSGTSADVDSFVAGRASVAITEAKARGKAMKVLEDPSKA